MTRIWLAAGAVTVTVALVVTGISGQVSSANSSGAASSVPATTTEEPWTPGVIEFNGDSVPAPRTTPLTTDDLDPNCLCIGFF